MRMWFEIQCSNTGKNFLIETFFHNQIMAVSCDCPAGRKGECCSHRINLLEGEANEVETSSHPIAELHRLYELSELKIKMAVYLRFQKQFQLVQKELETATADLNAHMNWLKQI